MTNTDDSLKSCDPGSKMPLVLPICSWLHILLLYFWPLTWRIGVLTCCWSICGFTGGMMERNRYISNITTCLLTLWWESSSNLYSRMSYWLFLSANVPGMNDQIWKLCSIFSTIFHEDVECQGLKLVRLSSFEQYQNQYQTSFISQCYHKKAVDANKHIWSNKYWWYFSTKYELSLSVCTLSFSSVTNCIGFFLMYTFSSIGTWNATLIMIYFHYTGSSSALWCASIRPRSSSRPTRLTMASTF